jgi:CRP/FNR family transcriptional regulator, cyclic AMP receptor protein
LNTMRKFGPGPKEHKPTIDTGINKSPDQPVTLRQNIQLIEVLQKIMLFKGLTLLQFREMLRICGRRSFKEGDYVCHMGEEAIEFFVLLQGTLKVMLQDDKVIARIEPIGVVGEMGVFTGEKRSANIVAVSPCVVLTVHRLEMLNLFRQDVDMSIKILMNVIQELSSKIRHDNVIIQQLRQLCSVRSGGDIIPDENDIPEIEKWGTSEEEI